LHRKGEKMKKEEVTELPRGFDPEATEEVSHCEHCDCEEALSAEDQEFLDKVSEMFKEKSRYSIIPNPDKAKKDA
jgi:hypothetical protein